VDGNFHGRAVGSVNAVPNPLAQLRMMAVAGRQVAAGLRNADDGLVRLQLLPGRAVVKMPFQVEGGRFPVAWIVEPRTAAQLASMGHGQLPLSTSVEREERPTVGEGRAAKRKQPSRREDRFRRG